ncbi:amino acid transporter [Trypanosoma grayi]|uniref:amino acid transporter n=1 Tax=Trypanosoma grayi TaxID=71804 RepID=UPI0004F42476|nr:amino acid transporter [Trypanosoma grayi]KEG07874.1 amino acid transporter [Trypanosoma grayi]
MLRDSGQYTEDPAEKGNTAPLSDEQENDAEMTLQYTQYEGGGSGATPHVAGDSDKMPEQAEHEKDGILGLLKKCVVTIIPPGGIVASAFNLASSSLGAGILGLPAATNSSGLVMALLFLAIITFLTIFSMRCLGIAAQRTQIHTFEGVARVLLGRWFAYFAAGVRAFHAFSGCVAYVISVGDIFSSIMNNSASVPEFLKTTPGNRVLTSAVWLCIMVPLVIPKHIDSLRYFSTFAVTFMVYFVIVIVVHSCMNGLPENSHNISVGKDDDALVVLFNTGNKAIEGLGVFMFAYVCQINAYEVYWDMENPTLTRYTLAAGLGMMLCFVLYALTSVFGYLDFGREVTDSILLMYNPIGEPMIMVAFVGVLWKLCASYALLSMAFRNAIYHSIGWEADKLPYWKHIIAVLVFAVIMLLCGLFIPKIKIVLGFAGGITGGSLGFLLPALFVMYSGGFSWKKVGAFDYICTYILLLSGVVGIIFGTGATIYGTAVG